MQNSKTNKIKELLDTRPWLLADGATGSNLFDVGLVSGDAPEIWNFEHPDRIRHLHQSFVDAGADIILSNSFGGTRYRLKLHQLDDRVSEVNRLAAQIARQVADQSGRDVIVAGSMGPTGEIMQPVGPLSHEDAVAAFAEQARALVEGGADVLWIETMSAREELNAAIEGAATTGMPVVCTVSFDTNGRTMMGLSAKDLNDIEKSTDYTLTACGTNCGVGASEVVACIHNMTQTASPDTILVAKGNAGIPQYVEGKICYNGTPELMAVYACMAYDAGARIIGGCCGTSPAHLKAMHEALSKHTRATPPSLEDIEAKLGPVSNGAKAQWAGQESRSAGAAAGATLDRGSRRRNRPAV